MSDGQRDDHWRQVLDRLATKRCQEAEKCALNLVWANRYDVEIRRIRAEIRRQRDLLKMMNSRSTKCSTVSSNYISLTQYERELQEGCELESGVDVARALSVEPALQEDTREHNAIPSIYSSVSLSFESREKMDQDSLLDQLEWLIRQPCNEFMESIEDVSVAKNSPLRRMSLSWKTKKCENSFTSQEGKHRSQGHEFDVSRYPITNDRFGTSYRNVSEGPHSIQNHDIENSSGGSCAEERAYESYSLSRYFFPKCSKEESNQNSWAETKIGTSFDDESLFAMSFIEGLKHRRSFSIENQCVWSIADEISFVENNVEETSTVSDSCDEEDKDKSDSESMPDLDDVTLLSKEREDFIELDNTVFELIRSIGDARRQSKIVFALESLCKMLEQRLEEEWWAAHDFVVTPSNSNYIV